MSEILPAVISIRDGNTPDSLAWWTSEFVLAPLNEDDPERLTDEQIIALKERLKKNDWLAGDICSYIALKFRSDHESLPATFANKRLETTVDEGINMPFDSAPQYAYKVAQLAVSGWFRPLMRALELPDAQWPAGMTPPLTFAMAMRELEAIRTYSQEVQATKERRG